MEIREHTVSIEQAGQRFDRAVEESFALSSRSEAQHLVNSGHVTLNNSPNKGSRKVKAGDHLCIKGTTLAPCEYAPENITLDVLHEDDSLIALNKPAGITVHPSRSHHTGTLLNALLYHCKNWPGINGVAQPGIVHRLDKDTSGVIVFAKTLNAHHNLQQQMADHTADKRYLAVINQPWPTKWKTLNQSIGPGPERKQQVGVGYGFKTAHTDVRSLGVYGTYTLVECRLFTGRTHQIRVHLCEAQAPIVGDTLYGGTKDSKRQALHAYRLSLIHPDTQQPLILEAPMPTDIHSLLNSMR